MHYSGSHGDVRRRPRTVAVTWGQTDKRTEKGRDPDHVATMKEQGWKVPFTQRTEESHVNIGM